MDNKNIKIGVFVLVGLVLVLGLVLLFASKRNNDTNNKKIVLESGSDKLEVEGDGSANLFYKGETYQLEFDNTDLSQLTKYLKRKGITGSVEDVGEYYILTIYENGEYVTYYIPKTDNFFDDLVEYVDDGGGGDENGDEDDDDYFEFGSPTPTNTSNPSGSASPTPAGTDIVGDCPMWLLSYCLWPRTPRPSGTPTPDPEAREDCSYWNQFIEGEAILSNTYCVSESPTPAP
jgi:hypothetical protein